MYTLPKSVQVGPFRFVLSREDVVDHASRWGQTNSNKRTIQFGVLCTGQQLAPTLIHELIHAVAEDYATSGGMR